MNRYRRASGNGSPGNNGFASHSMQPDAEGHLLLTDYEGKKIRVLDPALVNDDLANDASIDLDDLSLSPGFKPKTLALCGDRWYATGDNDAINIYERQSNEWSKKIKTVKGYAFSLACPHLCAKRLCAMGFGHAQFQTDTGENAGA